MKKVLSNNIATDVRQPYTKVTHEWYNAMITEAIEALGKGLVGTNSEFTVLYGCVNSDSPDADISAGAIFYNGEIYLCPAFVDATITNDIVGTITTAYDASDPILFSDGNSYDVHQIKTIVWSDAASGSGDIDFDNLKYSQAGVSTYTPTLVGYDNGGSVVVGGFTGTDAGCTYNLNTSTLTLNIVLSSVDVLNTVFSLGFSLPTNVINTLKLQGYSMVDYYDGSAYTVKKASINLASSGSGEGLRVRHLSNTAFPTTTAGSILFTIVITIS